MDSPNNFSQTRIDPETSSSGIDTVVKLVEPGNRSSERAGNKSGLNLVDLTNVDHREKPAFAGSQFNSSDCLLPQCMDMNSPVGRQMKALRERQEEALREKTPRELVQVHLDNLERYEREKSYLDKASVYLYEGFSSKSNVEDLRQAMNDSSTSDEHLLELLEQSKRDLEFEKEYAHYSTGFLKTGSLFMRNRIGLAASVASFALDQAKPADDLATQALDGTLGSLKGASIKGSFHAFGNVRSIAAKGVFLGGSARALELGLSRETYINPENNKFDWRSGVDRTLGGTLSPEALVADAAVFTLSHGIFGKLDSASGNMIKRSPILSNMATGFSFGASSGSLEEIHHQRENGRTFGSMDWLQIMNRGMIKGSIDTFAAIPGGLQSRNILRSRQIEARESQGRSAPSDSRLDMAIEVARPRIHRPAEQLLDLRDIAHVRISDKSSRIADTRQKTELLPALKDGRRAEFQNQKEFVERNLAMRPTDVVALKLSGSEIEFIMPREYARSLQEVRELRQIADRSLSGAKTPAEAEQIRTSRELLERHVHGKRLLPEDLLPLLKDTPDPALIKRVVLNDGVNPMDAYYQSVHHPLFRSMAEARTDGSISFFAVERPARSVQPGQSLLREVVNHEWSHLFKWSLGSAAGQRFEHAMRAEPIDASRDPLTGRYSRSADETWAVVMGEGILHRDADFFHVASRMSPIKVSVMARELAEHMQRIPNEQRSPSHEVIVKRLQLVNSETLPLAEQNLLASLPSSGLRGSRASVLSLLSELNGGNGLSKLPLQREVSLVDTRLTLEGVQRLAAHSELQTLNLSGTNINREMLISLGNSRVEKLSLARTKLGDDAIPELMRMKDLKEVDLSTTNISRRAINQLRISRPDLKVVFY